MDHAPSPLATQAQVPADRSLTEGEVAQILYTETLLPSLIGLLERRYLLELPQGGWRLRQTPGDDERLLLREVLELARPSHVDTWGRAMAHVLSACHQPGHALVMALHGDATRHRLYLGGRRIAGMAAGATDAYLEGQESAFKAFFTGLELSRSARRLDGTSMEELALLIQTAPALAVVTGLPSGKGGPLPHVLQSLDRLVEAVGGHRYLLMGVAEPLEPQVLDQTIDACRTLLGRVQSNIRRTINRTRSQAEGETRAEGEAPGLAPGADSLPAALYLLAACFGFREMRDLASALSQGGMALSSLLMQHNTRLNRERTQLSTTKSWAESGGIEVLNAHAEACASLLRQHIDRFQAGKSTGWWRTAVYLAAEDEATLERVSGAVRSLCSGDLTALDPIRTLRLPSALQGTLRDAIQWGRILALEPAGGQASHPLGPTYETLGTCLSSAELAVLVNLPQRELPGLPMRERSEFGLNIPAAPSPRAAPDEHIELGRVLDSLGRPVGPVTVTRTTLNRHTLISGNMGSGKTNTCFQLLLETYTKLHVPFLVIEPAKGEYRRLRDTPALAHQLRVYTMDDSSPWPFRLNPLSPPLRGITLAQHIDQLKAIFNGAFPMGGPISYILEEAIQAVYLERGWSLESGTNRYAEAFRHRHYGAPIDVESALAPCLEDLYAKVDEVVASKRYDKEIELRFGAALRTRIHNLMIGPKGRLLNTRRSTPIEEILAQPAVIELKDLKDDDEKAFIMALLFVRLYDYAEARQHDLPDSQKERLQHLTLIEEAHQLLEPSRGPVSAEVADPRAKMLKLFTNMLAEMRALGEGFVIVDQIPTKLTSETLKNTNLKIIHRLVAPDDRLAVGSSVNLSERQIRHLTNLKTGLAVVHDETIGDAVLAHIHHAKGDVALSALGASQQRPPIGERYERRFLYRNESCYRCPAPCTFFPSLPAAPEEVAERLSAVQPVVQYLFLHDFEAAWASWVRWRDAFQAEHAILFGLDGQHRHGVTYCAFTQAAYAALGDVLRGHGRGTRAPAALLPDARLQQEVAARALADLAAIWVPRSDPDEACREAFTQASGHVEEALSSEKPPTELPGCQRCPRRCRVLHLVRPHLADLDKRLPTKVQKHSGFDTATQLSLVQQEIMNYTRDKEPAIQQTLTHDAVLYCTLTNLTLPGDQPTAREELLELLRQRFQPAAAGTGNNAARPQP